MKTNSTIAGAGNLRRHALTAALAAIASLATLGSAATFNSPVGKWDCIMSGGGQEGITVIEFYDTGSTNGRTFSGYQLLSTTPKKSNGSSSRGPGQKQPTVEARGWPSSGTNDTSGSTNLFGLNGISGPWEYDSSGRVIGQFVQIVANYDDPNSPTTNGVSFSAKVAPGKRLTLVSSTPNGKVNYRGVPFEALGDISGSWQGVKKQNKQEFVEFFTLSAYAGYPNLYTAQGSGPGYYYSNGIVNFVSYTTNTGTVIITNIDGSVNIIPDYEIITTNTYPRTNFNWCLLSTQKKIGFDITEVAGSNGTARASYGNFKSSKNKTSAKTKGIIVPGTAISFDADRNAGQAAIPPAAPPDVVTNQP
jgi:hypothetical protein